VECEREFECVYDCPCLPCVWQVELCMCKHAFVQLLRGLLLRCLHLSLCVRECERKCER